MSEFLTRPPPAGPSLCSSPGLCKVQQQRHKNVAFMQFGILTAQQAASSRAATGAEQQLDRSQNQQLAAFLCIRISAIDTLSPGEAAQLSQERESIGISSYLWQCLLEQLPQHSRTGSGSGSGSVPSPNLAGNSIFGYSLSTLDS